VVSGLIVLPRHAMALRRFVDFQQELGYPPKICLSRPLGPLEWRQRRVEKSDVAKTRSRFELPITGGKPDLFRWFIALRQWGNKWNRVRDASLAFATTGQQGSVQMVQSTGARR